MVAENDRQSWDRAVAAGWPEAQWGKWFFNTDLNSEEDKVALDRSVAGLRERWVAEHPEHREMLESLNPDAWDAAEAARDGRQWTGSTRGDRARWPA